MPSYSFSARINYPPSMRAIFTDAQGTYTRITPSKYDFPSLNTSIPESYDGSKGERTTYYFYGTGGVNYFFDVNGQFLTEVPSDRSDFRKYLMTVVFVNPNQPLTATNGSLNITINGFDNTPLETIQVIPGKLDTTILANGDYADFSILTIFERMKKYAFTESIFTSIQCTLAAFFVSIALEQRITERIESLVKKISVGEINIDQFIELVQQGNEEFASEYGNNYVSNYVKLQNAIDKYKYIVETSIIQGV